jgi:hypothetical protein
VAPQSNEGLYREVVRLRDQVHELTRRVDIVELHGEQMKQTLDRVETQVNRLSTADEIAEAVAKHDRSRGTLRLKPAQKAAIIGGLGLFVAGVLRGLFGIEVGH